MKKASYVRKNGSGMGGIIMDSQQKKAGSLRIHLVCGI